MHRAAKIIVFSRCFCSRTLRPDARALSKTNYRAFSKSTSSAVLGERQCYLGSTYQLRYGGLEFHSTFNQLRVLSTTRVVFEDSKVEQQLESLKEKKKDEEAKSKQLKVEDSKVSPTSPDKQNASVSTIEDSRLRRIWVKVKKEAVHYYNGFKLFFFEVRVSSKLLLKVAKGNTLSWRERKQLIRTAGDIFRLVPFSLFIIIPFMELLLPVALKLFPGMLPSTFEEKASKEAKNKQRFKLKLEMAKFLQDTVEQMAVKRGTGTSETAHKFAEFLTNVRQGDQAVSNEEILKFSKAFRDTLMMDNLERQQLVAICKILNIPTIANTAIMRFQITLRMRKIKAQDQEIQQEGDIANMQTGELQGLVRERGMRAYGVSKQRLVKQMEEWIDLHLNGKVPLSLLLLSRTLYIPPSETGTDPTATEQLKATISSLPEETSESVKLGIEEVESGEVDNQARLEQVKHEQEEIAKEAAEKEESLKKAQELAMKSKQEESERILDTALHDFPPGYTSEVQSKSDKAPAAEQPPAPELTPNVIKAVEEVLTDIAESKSHVSEERDDFNELVHEIQDYNASLKETLEAGEEKVKVRTGSKLLSKYLQRALKNMDKHVDKIEADRKSAEDSIEQLSQEKKEALDEQTVSMIDSKIETHEGTVATIDEVRTAMKTLSEVLDDKTMSEIFKIIDPDKDGKVDLDIVLKAIEFMSEYTGESSSGKEELKELIDVLNKEMKIKSKNKAANQAKSEQK